MAKGTQLSPYLEMCCLRISANVSYAHAQEDVELLTGIRVSQKTQQRLVQRQEFVETVPEQEQPVAQVSVDGGQMRLITPKGEQSEWKQYKAVRLNQAGVGMAWFQDNAALVNWVRQQELTELLYCLGDGHPGIWSLVEQLVDDDHRCEILDWYHLMENLYKVPGSLQRLSQVRELLWHGQVNQAIAIFDECHSHQAKCFQAYLRQHQRRIPNYAYYQAENICSIGSGTVESWVKQIDARLQLSGSRWKAEHAPQALAHRCAYLNGQLSPPYIFL